MFTFGIFLVLLKVTLLMLNSLMQFFWNFTRDRRDNRQKPFKLSLFYLLEFEDLSFSGGSGDKKKLFGFLVYDEWKL